MSDTSVEQPVRAVIPMALPVAASTGSDASRVAGFNLLLASTFLSPLCIAASFGYLMGPEYGIFATVVLLATLTTGVMSSVKLAAGGVGVAMAGRVFDGLAAVGLIAMSVLPALYSSHEQMEQTSDFPTIVAVAFGLMALSTPRFLFEYGAMAAMARSAGRTSLARFSTIVAILKLLDESVMLTAVCVMGIAGKLSDENTAMMSGFVSLAGIVGYAVIWVPTLVLHIRLRSLAKNPIGAAPSGFDVLVKPVEALPVDPVNPIA